MEELIMKLKAARRAIQNLEFFVPTAHNCNQILGSVQQLDAVIAALPMVIKEAQSAHYEAQVAEVVKSEQVNEQEEGDSGR